MHAGAQTTLADHTMGSAAQTLVAEGFWVELALGSEWTPARGGGQLISLANLKYAFTSKPRFDRLPGIGEGDR